MITAVLDFAAILAHSIGENQRGRLGYAISRQYAWLLRFVLHRLASPGIAWHRLASPGIAWHRLASPGIAWLCRWRARANFWLSAYAPLTILISAHAVKRALAMGSIKNR